MYDCNGCTSLAVAVSSAEVKAEPVSGCEKCTSSRLSLNSKSLLSK